VVSHRESFLQEDRPIETPFSISRTSNLYHSFFLSSYAGGKNSCLLNRWHPFQK
jgi:hypothetical protein